MRRAFNYAFDFEEMNKQLSTASTNASTAISTAPNWPRQDFPQGKELEILETVRDKVPAEVFTTPYTNPVGGNPEEVRDNLREATRLLKEAGFEIRDRKLVDPTASRSASRFLPQDHGLERMGCSTSRRSSGSASR